MKRFYNYYVPAAILSVTAILSVFCADTARSQDIRGLISESVKELGVEKGDPGLCAITDAGYVIINGETTEKYVDIIQEETGCSVGRNNLLFVQRHTGYPLKIALFRKDTYEMVGISYDGTAAEKTARLYMSFNTINDKEPWGIIQKALGGDAFSFLTVAHHWAAGAPHDFFKCVELHNHICPGITSGYFIAKFMQKKYPLQDGESYTYISCPPWCKDDAIQVLLDKTPGRRGIFVKQISDEQKERLVNPSVAGIMLINMGDKKGAKAVILSFDWDKASELAGSKNLEGLQSRLKTITGLIPYYDKPGLCVNVLKEYDITSETAEKLTLAGVNPYEELGFVKK